MVVARGLLHVDVNAGVVDYLALVAQG